MGYAPRDLLHSWNCTCDCMQIQNLWGTSLSISTGRMIVGISANTCRFCKVVPALRVARSDLLYSVSLWQLYPFLLTCWVQERWRSLTRLHKHAAHMFDASPSHVSCSIHPSWCLGLILCNFIQYNVSVYHIIIMYKLLYSGVIYTVHVPCTHCLCLVPGAMP